MDIEISESIEEKFDPTPNVCSVGRRSHDGWIGFEKVRELSTKGVGKVVAARCKACGRVLKGHTRSNLVAHKNTCTQISGEIRKSHDGWVGFEKVRETTVRGTGRVVAAQCKACKRILKGHTKANLDAHKLTCPKLTNKPVQPLLSANGQKFIVLNGVNQGQTVHAKLIPLIVNSDGTIQRKVCA
ncbi:hypothetical protein QAD02_018740 [Eretmocerus hayati]|uniref:Uncharacterized protein n=1 Tax=Eretmocerus hayati TaxID=131215 RepID=A0ACC2PIT4_9HYME|nr:hypothetical protein QAD02_018740 [Eretmocerus hayati]